jgi:hypothetical protein
MPDGDLREQILRLEEEIEQLAETLERCRKLLLMSKAAISMGAILIIAMTFGAIRSDAIGMVGALAAVVGGTVVYGSNASTAKQTADAMKAAEARRAELIGSIDLRLVGESESES